MSKLLSRTLQVVLFNIRFSDPGLGPADSSSDDGSGSVGDMNDGNSPATVGLVLTLMEQVNALQDSNRRLFRELHNTRAELEALKLQTASWRQLPPEYEPGMLSGMLRLIPYTKDFYR